MKRYRVTCYPHQHQYSTVVEAESVQEALTLANEEAAQNCAFSASEGDVEEI